MKLLARILILGFFVLQFTSIFSQQIKFEKVLDGSITEVKLVRGIVQDKQGYIWISNSAGLYRYDGLYFKPYIDSSLTNNITCLAIDADNNIWFGTYGSGIEKFNPATNTFTSFQHHSRDASTLLNNTITCIRQDHLNNIWIGTSAGLDKLDKTTGKITHYKSENNNASSLSNNYINTIYEDKQGTIWIGCGFPFDNTGEENGGLNSLDVSTGKFTHYFNKPGDTSSLVSNKVMSVFEDSKGNFWVGTGQSGLHIMDRETGKFIRIPYDPSNPEKLNASPSARKNSSVWDVVTFINDDSNGNIWIGSFNHGMNRYNPISNNMIHFGNIELRTNPVYYKEDTLSGFRENGAIFSICSKDGTYWVTDGANLYKIIQPPANIPYYDIEAGANSFYAENDSILWIATSIKGLDKRNTKTGENTWFTNTNGNINAPPDHDILGLRADAYSNLWIATFTGLYKLNLNNKIFTRYLHDPKNNNSIAGDSIQCLNADKQNIWMGFLSHGLDKMNILNGTIKHYIHNNKDSNSITNNLVNCISEDKNNDIWIGTITGVDRLNQKTNRFTHYLKQSEVLSICIDAEGMIWAGTTNGFYYFDVRKNSFTKYVNQNAPITIANVLHILEDNQHNLWLTTPTAILKIDRKANSVNVYGKNYGVHYNNYYDCDNYKLKNGQLLIGDQNGYYLISPSAFNFKKPMVLNFTSFKIGDEEVQPLQSVILNAPMSQAKEITLTYKQNIFSFSFSTTDYANSGEIKYLFMLENYDNAWRDIGTEHKAYFFNVPPGNYIFHVKAINPDGLWTEKSISIIISPPWWRTWWAYTIFALVLITAIWGFIYYRSLKLRRENKLLEEKVNHRTEQLKKLLEDLKSTQTQLIQSEKMASLGELTAGIAHEIQNPLNFVNNFSEVNQELISELVEEVEKGNTEEVKAIANDIKENEEKINHHGRRADAIVKGMLQHSRQTKGIKEPTDINTLCDEYLRLSYHGLRAKDKSFNADFKTDFDENIGKINIVPQDIGRVLLNLFNNAFYAVNEKQKAKSLKQEEYKPLVTVATKSPSPLVEKGWVEVIVTDNGNGIPQNIIDKIFQPFFTTKPTGEGTGLGLSLSYDIVKAHSGEIKVETKEGIGTDFIIRLPG